MLKIGVLGAGHLGKIHIKCIKQIERYELVGFYDPDTATAKAVEEEMGVRGFGRDPHGAAFRVCVEGVAAPPSCLYREAHRGNARRGHSAHQVG